MKRALVILTVCLYPLVAVLMFTSVSSLLGIVFRADRYSAIASGVIVFLLLWLGVLPRDLSLPLGAGVLEPR